MNQKITYDILIEKLFYDQKSGLFYWKKNGDSAGYPKLNGYLQVRIDGKYYLLHRLAWMYVYGDFPDGDIDHINRNRSDNKIKNLRVATRCQNQQNRNKQKNNTSGVTGVVYSKKYETWRARIKENNNYHHLGSFSSFEAAVKARKNAEMQFHKGEA